MNSSFIGLGTGIVFAIILVYLLMVVNFQTLIDPLIIICALPGALSGILWMLYLTATTFSVPSLMGTIMCIGVATANSILVITFANDRRQFGDNALEAAYVAGRTRLTPGPHDGSRHDHRNAPHGSRARRRRRAERASGPRRYRRAAGCDLHHPILRANRVQRAFEGSSRTRRTQANFDAQTRCLSGGSAAAPLTIKESTPMETTHRPEMNRKSWPNNVALIGGAILLVILFGVGLVPKLHAQDKLTKRRRQAGHIDRGAGESVVTPKPSEAAPDDLQSAWAISKPFSRTHPIQARTSGYVSKMYVDIGSKVKAGQVLADIESPDVDQQLGFQAFRQTPRSPGSDRHDQSQGGRRQAEGWEFSRGHAKPDGSKHLAGIKQCEAALDGAPRLKYEVASAKSQDRRRGGGSGTKPEQGVALQKANLAQAAAQYDLAETTEKRYRDLLA